MRITSGDFLNSEGGSLYIPPKLLHSGWGNSVSVHVVGPDTKPLPDRVRVTFYSYLEDKLYRGEFPLPYERILDMFAKGYISYDTGRREHTTYRKLIAGVAPGGAVAVWVSGIDRQYEVFFGYAKAVAADWHETIGMPLRIDRAQYLQQSLQEAAKYDPMVNKYRQSVPFGLWETYRKRYHWWPVVEGMPQPERIGRMSFLNGERDVIELPLDDASKRALRPIPTYANFVVHHEPGKVGSMYELKFDQDETMNAFAHIAASGKPFQLVFHDKIRDGSEWFSVLVRNEDEEIKLSQGDFQIYEALR